MTPDISTLNGDTTFPPPRPKLKVFLCHSSGDKDAVRQLYKELASDGYDPWLDAVNLLPGQEWESEIKKAVRSTHVAVVCLSNGSITRTGFVQREIRFVLDIAHEQPEGRIYLIPARLEEAPVPERLRRWHWVNLYEADGYQQLLLSLRQQASEL